MHDDATLHTWGPNIEFVEALLSCNVRFLIIGGLAVKYFCPEREVDDLDLMIEPTLDNAKRFVQVLDRFSPNHGLAPSSLVGPGKQLSLKNYLFLDVLTPRTETSSFDVLWKTAVSVRLDWLTVLLPSRNSLLELKRHAAKTDSDPERREKHQKDVSCLEQFTA
jgi:hypothetical protein